MTRLEWMTRNLVIEPKSGGRLIRYAANQAQVLIYAAIERQRRAGLPVRLIILKGRQLGCTTGVGAWYFTTSLHRAHHNALIAAHDDDASSGIYRKYQRFYENLEPDKRLATKYSTKKEVVFAPPHSSRIVVQTAGKLALGRSDTFQDSHLSEVAWWPHPSETMGSIQQTIPDDRNTSEIWESTANGAMGLFFDAWYEAVDYRRRYPENLDGFTPLFLPWTLNPEYSRHVPEGVSVEKIEGLTPEQSYWRQRAIVEKCQNDIGLFKQEYPLTPDEAFRASGAAVFSADLISRYRKICRPGRFAEITAGGIAPSVSRTNCWEIWDEPRKYGQYIVAADVAEGELSDKAAAQSERDYSAAVILDRHSLSVVGVWHGRADTHLFGRTLLQAARHYNNAWASPEVNGAGIAVLNVLRENGYEKIYQRQNPDEAIEDKDRPQYGWKTTVATRRLMADEFIRMAGDPGLTISSNRIVDEMQTFIRDNAGKPVHSPGKHDDLLFALMIALQLHLRLPLKSEPLRAETTMEQDTVREPVGSMAYAGGYDTWEPEDED